MAKDEAFVDQLVTVQVPAVVVATSVLHLVGQHFAVAIKGRVVPLDVSMVGTNLLDSGPRWWIRR